MVIERIRCFEKLELDFNQPRDGSDGWTVLVGVNGVGKSTVLQSVVLGFMDPRPATSLIDTPSRLYRSGDEPGGTGTISVTLQDELYVRRVSGKDGSYIEDASPIRDAVSLTKPPLILGFSARRRIAHKGEGFEAENLALHRVQGLFRNDHPLLTQDPFAGLRTGAARRRFAAVVRDVLTKEIEGGARMFPLVDVLELRGKGGVDRYERLLEGRRFQLRYGARYKVRVSVEELSDGYQAMLALVLEILSQAALFRQRVPDPSLLQAVILIDELEAHLHPKWQRTVVPLLRAVFPQCQFVVTTHSPLVVASARPGEVTVLQIGDDGAVHAERVDSQLTMKDAEEIYEEIFQVDRMAPPDAIVREREYLHQLASDHSDVDPELAQFIETAWANARRDSSGP
jgi:predicted ATPase